MKKAKVEFQLLLFLIIVILTSASVLSLIKFGILVPKDNSEVNILNTEFVPFVISGELKITDFKLCELVDPKYRCFNEKNVFKLGDKMDVVLVVYNDALNGDIIIVQNYKIFDSQENLVFNLDFNKNNYFNFKTDKQGEIIAISNSFNLTDINIGNYRLDMYVHNPLLNKNASISKEFRIE